MGNFSLNQSKIKLWKRRDGDASWVRNKRRFTNDLQESQSRSIHRAMIIPTNHESLPILPYQSVDNGTDNNSIHQHYNESNGSGHYVKLAFEANNAINEQNILKARKVLIEIEKVIKGRSIIIDQLHDVIRQKK